jgi:hypothetical protein
MEEPKNGVRRVILGKRMISSRRVISCSQRVIPSVMIRRWDDRVEGYHHNEDVPYQIRPNSIDPVFFAL